MSFTEATLEQAIIDLIQEQDYQYVKGDDLHRELDNVLIEDDLRSFLSQRYQDKGITSREIDSIIKNLHSSACEPLYEANRDMFLKMVNGRIFVRDDRSQKDFLLQLLDFDNPDNNIFRVVNQLTIKSNTATRRPDAIIYINGLPMVVFEFKSAVKEEATIHDAFTQLTVRYRRDIPELFKYNAFVVLSDGVNSKVGSLFADYTHFYAWRRVDEDSRPEEGIDSLYTMIQGLFTHERLLDMIHNYIYFPDTVTDNEMKVVASYPQYFAAKKLLRSVIAHMQPNGDGKGGTYFGTTGCGKSFIMLFLTRLLMRSPKLGSPTIVLITDRTELDDQLSKTFVDSKTFIGDKAVLSVESREDLKAKLSESASGGVYLTTIQKFAEDFGKLSDRSNIICISDEAHRSQINMDATTKRKGDELVTKYGFAKFMHTSLPNATYVGFTGTPIDKTTDVFGDIVDQYNMTDSVKDGITVRLVYDGRPVKACLDQERVKAIEAYYAKCLQDGSNEYQVEESKKSVAKIDAILSNPDIMNSVADYFIDHYETRVKEGLTVAGKCMFLCANRYIAYDFYKLLKAKRPQWFDIKRAADESQLSDDQLKKLVPMPMCKVVATRGKDDPKDMYDLMGNKEGHKVAAAQFKDINSNFKIAIVVDMWLTGMDVPFLDTMYIYKPLVQKHTIIQTVSRVNRAFEGKENGLIVDFFGIKPGLTAALKMYTDFKKTEFDKTEDAIRIVRDELEVLDSMLHPFNSSKYFSGNPKERLDCLKLAAEFVQVTNELEKRFILNVRRLSQAYKLCNGAKDFSNYEIEKIHFYMGIKSIIFKLNKGDAPDISMMNATVKKMLQDAIKSDGIEDLFSTEKNLNMEGIDLFSAEYMAKISRIKLPNTKIKILQQLIKAAVNDMKKVNRIKAKAFSEMLAKVVERYNNRVNDEAVVKEILDDTSKKLMDLAERIRKEKEEFEAMGIDYEEKAFFDVLVAVADKFKFEFPDDENKVLAKAIREKVKDVTKYSDWANRADIRAEMQCDIIMLLAEHGYPPTPPEVYEKVYADIIQQAENFRKYCD